MTTAPKSTNNPKFAIDKSKEKYHTRYERLLNILFYAKELPSDLYTQMNMSYENYKKAIAILKKRELIKKINKDRAIGYILTTKGKKLIEQQEYRKYENCFTDSRKYDIKHRNRKRQFAYLYALFDRVGIIYEDYAKPLLTSVKTTDNEIHFYTALDLKRMVGIEATTFMGSRLLGFFIGKGKIIPVYRTNQMLKTFGSHEALIPEFMKQHFSVLVDTAVLICESEEAVVDITYQIFQNQENNPKVGINTAHYKKFYILPSNDTFLERFEDLYIDPTKIEQSIYEQYNVSKTLIDSQGNKRVIIGNGFIGDYPLLICPGNINVVQVKEFIRDAEITQTTNYIICKKREEKYIRSITDRGYIKVITF